MATAPAPGKSLPVSIDDVRAARVRIGDAIVRTPTLHSQTLSQLTGANVWLKFENLQFTAAYKERGALNALILLGGTVQFWVSDNGRGIDPEFQKRVFERFQSRPVPGGHRGPGLGLCLTHHNMDTETIFQRATKFGGAGGHVIDQVLGTLNGFGPHQIYVAPFGSGVLGGR